MVTVHLLLQVSIAVKIPFADDVVTIAIDVQPGRQAGGINAAIMQVLDRTIATYISNTQESMQILNNTADDELQSRLQKTITLSGKIVDSEIVNTMKQVFKPSFDASVIEKFYRQP